MRLRPILPALAVMLCVTAACGQSAETQATDTSEAPAPARAAEPAQSAPLQSTIPTAGPDAATLGEAAAPVTIIEYASVTCPHCATFHETLFPHIQQSWIDTGRAKLVMRPLPTAPAQLAVAGFILADCAGPDGYFDVLGELFATQGDLFAAAQANDVGPYYEGIAANHGLSNEQMEACFAEEARFEKIEASVQAAQDDMVSGTPSFVINGQLFSAAELHDAASWDAALQTAYDAAQN